MADPTLVLLIVIGASAADRPHSSTVGDAISDALGRGARILVEERSSALPDADAVSVADGIGGSAVAEIAWGDEAHTRARLHVYLAVDRTWYDREVSFEPGDALDERERAIGFLVGAMVRETEGVALALPPRSAPVVSLSGGAPVPPLPVQETVAPPPPPRQPSRFAADIAGVMTSGIEGDAASLGPSVRGHVFFAQVLSLHAGASVGFGSVDAAEARTRTTRIMAGGRWRWLTVGRDLSFDLGVDALAVHHAVRRTDPAADRDRWLMGAHADVGIGWRMSAVLEPYATGGLDAVVGNTPINVAGSRLGLIPPFRAVAELGVKMHF